jgi:hypothetical protein
MGDKMIVGLKNWDNPACYYSQENNAIEEISRKLGIKNYLETCGPSAMCTLISAIDENALDKFPIQPEDILTCWLNDPRNYSLLLGERKDINPINYMGNRIPQYYPIAIFTLFGFAGKYESSISLEKIKTAIDQGHGVMACLKSPGHFIPIVAYEDDEIIYHDPWPGNSWPARFRGSHGRNRRIAEDERQNLQNFYVEVWK